MNKWDSEILNKYNQPRLAYKDRNSLEDSEMKEGLFQAPLIHGCMRTLKWQNA